MQSNDDKVSAVYFILSQYHEEVLASAGLKTPTFARLRKNPDFETRVRRFAYENLHVIDALSQTEDVNSEEALEYRFAHVQDMTNKYLRDVLPPEEADESYDGDLTHLFWEKRRMYINNLITRGTG